MVCIYCGNDTKVTNSRHQKSLNQVWRRRRCLSCGNDFTTHEIAALETSWVVSNKSQLEPFSADLLFVSIYEACKHRTTAVSDARGLLGTIIGLLDKKTDGATLQRAQIIGTALEVLERFDKTAAAVYGAYHKI